MSVCQQSTVAPSPPSVPPSLPRPAVWQVTEKETQAQSVRRGGFVAAGAKCQASSQTTLDSAAAWQCAIVMAGGHGAPEIGAGPGRRTEGRPETGRLEPRHVVEAVKSAVFKPQEEMIGNQLQVGCLVWARRCAGHADLSVQQVLGSAEDVPD